MSPKNKTIINFNQLNLNPKIQKALVACDYDTPTTVQSKSIPEILAGKDVIVSAKTGTGKTAAFVLPALERLSQQASQKKPRVLILTPTRELAAQILAASEKYGKFLHPKIVSLVGGVGYPQQIKALAKPVDIIVATPGRLMDHLDRGRIDLSELQMLILDEADRMLDMGFIDDVRTIAKTTPKSRQTLLFSATINKQISTIAKHLLQDPLKIECGDEFLAPDKIHQSFYTVNHTGLKDKVLEHLLNEENIFKAIIFTATKRKASEVAEFLESKNFQAAALHGDLKQSARNRTIEKLRLGKIQYLVATDVAARGINISDLTHVINYDLPKFSEDYVHRIGRTGRAGKTGTATSLVTPKEFSFLRKIEKFINQKIEAKSLSGFKNEGFDEARENTHKKDSLRPKTHRKGGNFEPRKKSFFEGSSDNKKNHSAPAARFKKNPENKPKASTSWDRDRAQNKNSKSDHYSSRSKPKPAGRNAAAKPKPRFNANSKKSGRF